MYGSHTRTHADTAVLSKQLDHWHLVAFGMLWNPMQTQNIVAKMHHVFWPAGVNIAFVPLAATPAQACVYIAVLPLLHPRHCICGSSEKQRLDYPPLRSIHEPVGMQQASVPQRSSIDYHYLPGPVAWDSKLSALAFNAPDYLVFAFDRVSISSLLPRGAPIQRRWKNTKTRQAKTTLLGVRRPFPHPITHPTLLPEESNAPVSVSF